MVLGGAAWDFNQWVKNFRNLGEDIRLFFGPRSQIMVLGGAAWDFNQKVKTYGN